jgi:phospholipid/cholesterol/gamma-HCH transport system substrate-binding protein
MRGISVAGRVAAIGAVVVACVVVAVLLFGGGGGGYTITARFLNGGQLVKGNLVQVGGTKAGAVKQIDITPDGQAVVELAIDDEFKPLRRGTKATIRQASQSGIANRYVDLNMPGGDSSNTPTIADGGEIGVKDTTTAVELDQLFNVFDPPTRAAVQDFLKNSSKQYAGKEARQRLAFKYLNPALSTSSRLFNELNSDKPLLEHFLVDSAELVTTLAERRDDLSGLITNANRTFTALSNERVALAEAIAAFPDFMRQANTTFVNLRAALDDVDPLVNASKPVAKKLQPFLAQLRPLARDARPTVRDLSRIVYRPGADNDLYNLTRSFPALASAALDRKQRNVDAGAGVKDAGVTDGAFPETAKALEAGAPLIAQGRPYTPDLFGWFDDFSTPGGVDALGGFSRAQVLFNALDLTSQVPKLIPLTDRLNSIGGLARTKQFKRCPGGGDVIAADRSNVLSAEEQQRLDCKEEDRAAGNLP